MRARSRAGSAFPTERNTGAGGFTAEDAEAGKELPCVLCDLCGERGRGQGVAAENAKGASSERTSAGSAFSRAKSDDLGTLGGKELFGARFPRSD
jgi:hypothetical protein